MEAVKVKKKKKSKKKWIVLIIILVIIAGLVAACAGIKNMAQAKLAAMNAMQTDEVTVRALTKSIGATGTVISIQSRDLVTKLSGLEVEQVHVEVGDAVEAGQALVQFDTEDIAQSLAAANKALDQTQGQYGISADNAQRQVEDAIRGAEYSIDMAQQNVDTAYEAYLDAWDALDTAQDAADQAWIKCEETEERLEDLEEEKEAAGESTVECEAQILMLKYQLQQTQAAAEQAEVAVEQAEKAIETLYDQYKVAQMNYENTVASADSSIAAARAAQDSTQLSQNTDQQQIQIDALSDQLREGTVTAPFAGVITAVNVDAGDTYLQGAIVTIQDCSSYEIEAQIGEYDISDVKLGQKVLIKTDATRDQELEGTVVFISPTATTVMDMMTGSTAVSADPTYQIRISVDTPSDRLRLDMSASLSIIIDQHENAMTVPYNAVQVAEDGTTFVEVVGADGESLTVVPVEVLMESNYYTEIAGELKEGDVVRVVAQQTSDMFSVMTEMGEGGF